MRLMSRKRFGALTASVVVLGLMIGVTQAGAQGSPTVLKFHNPPGAVTGVGFDANNPHATPPVGSSIVIRVKLDNIGSQFGKPSGAIVGRVLLDCTILVVNFPQGLDGLCTGIAHVPNGFFTFAGSGNFSNAKVNYYDITGGVGPYANDRGQIRVANNADGSSDATVTLSS
jgi:hypothetical protein